MFVDVKQGYAHPAYAASLAEFGTPRHLPKSDGWVLVRPTPEGSQVDATGCYPLFACANWNALASDLDGIEDLVSLALVADPFGNHTPELLSTCFPDVCKPFKEHFVVDLAKDPKEFVASHHRRNVRKGLKNVAVEECNDPIHYLADWMRLYDILIERHRIQGIASFSASAFNQQLQLPGTVVFRAVKDGKSVGMLLWCVHDDVAYYHLGAYDDVGYQQKASFALFWHAIEYFKAKGLKWLNLGAGAGVKADTTDGLTRFKAGWSSDTRTAYFCGRVFNRDVYDFLARQRPEASGDFFPIYRSR